MVVMMISNFPYFAFRSDPKPFCFVSAPTAPGCLGFKPCRVRWASSFILSSCILHTTYLSLAMAQPTKDMMTLTTPPLTPTSPAWSSYDSPVSVGQHRVGYYSSSDPPGVSTRTVDSRQLSWWRAWVRNALMKSLVHESRILGAMQVRGTHSPVPNYKL